MLILHWWLGMTSSSEPRKNPTGSENLDRGLIHMLSQYIVYLSTILVPVVSIILLIWSISKAHNNFLVDAVQLPEAVAKAGFTPEEATQQLVEQMVLLRRVEYNDKLPSRNPDIELTAGIPGGKDIQIPGTGIGLRTCLQAGRPSA